MMLPRSRNPNIGMGSWHSDKMCINFGNMVSTIVAPIAYVLWPPTKCSPMAAPPSVVPDEGLYTCWSEMYYVIISVYILKLKNLISSDCEFVSLSKSTGAKSVRIGCAKITRALKLHERFSAIINNAFMNWRDPLKLFTSKTSSIEDTAWIIGVERSLERISGLIYKSINMFMW